MNDKLYVILLGFICIIVSGFINLVYSNKVPGFRKGVVTKKGRKVSRIFSFIGNLLGLAIIFVSLFYL